MIIRLLSLLILFGSLNASAQNWNHHSVLFGEESLEIAPAPEHVVRIFIDKEGYLYPEMLIKDRKLRKASSSLRSYFTKNENELNELCASHGLGREMDQQAKIAWLLESIAVDKINEINAKVPEYTSVITLIHGFRKKAYGRTGFHSSVDYRILESDMKVKEKNVLVIEVYWDGTYISPIRGYKYRGFRLLEEQALPNAEKVGEGLRRVLSFIETPTLTILCHSLGAKVASNILFNQNNETLPTPPQKHVNICLVAPAIGSEEFEFYWNRSNSAQETEIDNYQFFIFYNENDFVLNKTFDVGPFSVHLEPTEYGNTSLGCNYNGDAEQVRTILKSLPIQVNMPKLINLSVRPNGSIITCHHLRCYTRYKAFLELEIW